MDQTTLLLLLFFVYLIIGGAVSLVVVLERSRELGDGAYRFSPTKAFLQHVATLGAALIWPFFASSMAQAIGKNEAQSFWVMIAAAAVAWVASYFLAAKPVIARSALFGGLLTLLLSFSFYTTSLSQAEKIVVPVVAILVLVAAALWPTMSGKSVKEVK